MSKFYKTIIYKRKNYENMLIDHQQFWRLKQNSMIQVFLKRARIFVKSNRLLSFDRTRATTEKK
jgi:hypothetical protein